MKLTSPHRVEGTIPDLPTSRKSLREIPEAVTAGGIPIRFRQSSVLTGETTSDPELLRLHHELARFRLLRGFDQLLCLDGLEGVEHLPHQIETVRKVLRHFRGRVLLADEVGLGKTIEACLLLREYLLRGLARRVLILVPAPLVTQWESELRGKFGLEFSVAGRTAATSGADFWNTTDRVLASLSYAKNKIRAEQVAAAPWDLVIVDEAHHCKNRTTKNWQLINSLQRKHMFLLTATPVQNNLLELYSLLTLLEPGHLRTEADFKAKYVRRGNPRDPRNRDQLRSLLGEVMIRNTRSLVQMDLPPRFAQTIVAEPSDKERELNLGIENFLRTRKAVAQEEDSETAPIDLETVSDLNSVNGDSSRGAKIENGDKKRPLTRRQLSVLLAAQGSHPAALGASLGTLAETDPTAKKLVKMASALKHSAKDEKLLDLLKQSKGHKTLVFVNFRRTLHRLQELLTAAGVTFSTFSGEQSSAEKDAAVEALRDRVPVMLCTDAGGEGRNLQFADTLINYDLPWNPMQIEQRIGRVHRIGQTRDVFVFNLCTAGSLEDRILKLLNEKIRMFELVVGEVGSILGNLDNGEEFESLVLNLWMNSVDDQHLDQSFDDFGTSLLDAQQHYVESKELDEALFGDDYQ